MRLHLSSFILRPLPLLALLLTACDEPRSAAPSSPRVEARPGHRESSHHAGGLPSPAPDAPAVSLTNQISPGEPAPPGEAVPTDEPTPAALRERFGLALKETDPDRRTKALEALAWEAVQAEPELFRDAFSELAAGSPEARRLLAHGGTRLADGDPEAALALAWGVVEDAEMAEVAGAIAVALSEKDPKGSAALVSKLTDDSVQARSAVQVLQRWSATEPAEAAAWVALFQEGPARFDGLSVVLQSWLDQDSPGLAAWLAAPASEKLRAEALVSLGKLIRQQPEQSRAASLSLFPQVELPE